MEYNSSAVSGNTSTIRILNPRPEHHSIPLTEASQPSSPRSSPLPSPPGSPSESISSLPSVGSSFFFSSAAASPPHSKPHSDHARESTQGLIIPSLTLPEALPRPTPYGKTLGDVRLLVIGDGAEDHTLVSSLLLDDNEDVVDIGTWDETSDGFVLRASTDWIEQRDAHGLEKFEPSRNFEIVTSHRVQSNASSVLAMIQSPFHSLLEIVDRRCQPSVALANLIASPWTPLYTALIILSASGPSTVEDNLIDTLAPHIPVVVLRYGPDRTQFPSRPHMSSFRPSSAIALRNGLFCSPETLSSLRYEAAERFLRWREVERAVENLGASHRETMHCISEKVHRWDKAKWEAEWELRFSQDVATRAGEGDVTERPDRGIRLPVPCVDPLHISSLVSFSLSFLDPIKALLRKRTSEFLEKLSDGEVRVALLGSFCIGLGLGLMIR
ncbi:hypothetical protein PAXRUDRAFT_825482 [Paxillus rubicundulus Ve08.2h10]|uniref:Uncharacterized protein n=1 Tax=Paxillus rubicundulus Ve08.2h10 TaxID=930991 RepID=A0A0D0E0I5_9AGAM|nr:hypothetical protein PAXRUDRAFT_825482 [Paxillus rubicundulus Ve08.2h10]